MAGQTFKPAKTGFSRVFLLEGRAGPTHRPDFQSNVKAGALSRGYGDIEKIEAPDPTKFDSFVQIGEIKGANERPTFSLMGRYALELKSEFMRMATAGCAFDVHINFGQCHDPREHNTFTKKIVIENAFATSYDVTDLGALASDDRAVIDETINVSGREVYELLELTVAARGGDVVTNEIVDITICDTPSCGDCETESDGCNQIYALSIAAGGSPSTPADVVYSLDGGTTWYAHDIDTLGAAELPTGIACLGAYIVVVSSGSNSLHYALKSDFVNGLDPTWTEVSTGFVTGGSPNAISSTGTTAFIVGNLGYIYKTSDPTSGVEVLDAGVSFPLGQYNDVHAYSDDFVIAVGNGGAIVKAEDGTIFSAVTPSPVGVGVHFNTVWAKSETEWWIGGSDGNLRYTRNSGTLWTTKAFSGSGTGVVHDIAFSNDTVGYLSHATAGNVGRMFRTTNGGYDWVLMPEGSGTFPANTKLNAIAPCIHDPNFVVAGGVNAATDGVIIVASA